MTLPALTEWTSTRETLHGLTRLLAMIRKAYLAPLPNAVHLALPVVPQGLTTGSLPLGPVILNLQQATIDHQGESFPIDASFNPAHLINQLDRAIPPLAHPLPTPLTIDHIAEYQAALQTIYTALARFRGRLFGTMTPAVVWSHGFDLSFLAFKGHDPDEHHQPHLNFGFSPMSVGFPRPYIYIYASPTITDGDLPPLARWYTDTWKGIVIDYDPLRVVADPSGALEDTLDTIYQRLMPRL